MKKASFFNWVFLVLGLALVVSCSKEEVEETTNSGGTNTPIPCVTDNLSFSNDIQPILQATCYNGCHNGSNPTSGDILLDSYAGVKTFVDNGRLLGSIRQESGFVAMPLGGGSLIDCDISKISQWIDDGAENN